MKKAIWAGLGIVLAGCASSGPIPTGKDTYMITKQSAGGLAVPGSKVKAQILVEANEFCAKSGKTMELLNASAKNAIPFARTSSAEISFKCVAPQ
ncbi:hypothetical protein G4G28_19175 [Massilia sp. Dwa41.01b]|uniref:hypothetical protein n=1 Tax=unclassified Massilia TaxID=2609279 RepID=UPI0016020055|nr:MULTISPECIES: hypothetical protein [unclassified Massilia]QNA90087.1 hypothetical protein G4G28_19175 [Massilia sp. Dwa41.01b]QNB00977.1 hypothetical protein G4G31_22780 [Massilia sp. Se16.2.3]